MKTSTFCSFVGLATLVLYLTSHGPILTKGPYVIDDHTLFAALPSGGPSVANLMQILTEDKSTFLPVVGVTHWLETWLAGGQMDRAFLFMHVMNLFYATLVAVVVFLLMPGRKKAPWLAALAAILFAVHPLHAVTVAWITARKDILVGLFMLLTVLFHRQGRLAAGVFCFLLAFLCKLSAYGLLVWIAVFEGLRGVRAREWKMPLARVAAYLAPSLIVLPLLTKQSLRVTEIVYLGRKALPLAASYLARVFFPYPLTQYYPVPRALPFGFTALCIVGLLAAVALAGRSMLKRKTSGEMIELAALVAACLAPYILWVPIHLFINNTYSYSLVAPVIMSLFAVAIRYAHRPAIQGALAGVLILLIGASTVYSRSLATEFYQPLRAYQRNVEIFPNDFNAYMRLGQMAQWLGETDEAIRAYEGAIDLNMHKRRRIYRRAFEEMARLALQAKRVDVLESLDALAARNNRSYYCVWLAQGVMKERQPERFTLSACRARYQKEMER